jgi:hypothetical protein
MMRRTFDWVPALDDPWRQVLAVRRDLIKIGQHRGPSPMDLDNSEEHAEHPVEQHETSRLRRSAAEARTLSLSRPDMSRDAVTVVGGEGGSHHGHQTRERKRSQRRGHAVHHRTATRRAADTRIAACLET